METKRYKIEDIILDISMGPFGSDIKKEVYTDSGVPVLNGSNLQGFELVEDSFGYVTEEKADSLKKANAHRGDIVITHRGTIGQIVYIPHNSKFDRYVISQSQFRVTCNTDIVLPEYLTYYFHTREGQHKLLSNASQVGVPALARASTTFRKLEVDLPSVEIQRKVMDIILELQQKIAVNRRICENLESQAQALFKHWFIDFAPFKDGKFVESEFGMIPEGWKVGTLGEIADVSSGKRPKRRFNNFNEEHSIPLIGASSVMGYTDEVFTSNKILLTGRVGTLGIVQRFNGGCWPSDNTLIIATNYYEFLYQNLKRINYLSMNRGTSQPLLTQGDLRKATIILPPKYIISNFENIANDLMGYLEYVNNESSRLSTLRDTLLPKLMSGQIKV